MEKVEILEKFLMVHRGFFRGKVVNFHSKSNKWNLTNIEKRWKKKFEKVVKIRFLWFLDFHKFQFNCIFDLISFSISKRIKLERRKMNKFGKVEIWKKFLMVHREIFVEKLWIFQGISNKRIFQTLEKLEKKVRKKL